MFRCQKCKKWLKNITTETDVVYDGTIYHATNVPAKICPECGKITIYEIIQERIVQYATQRNVKNIDYAECENEEASASQLSFCLSINIVNFNFDNFISTHTKQLVLGLTAFFLIKIQVYRIESKELEGALFPFL